jgi:hypothetical protein
MGASVLKTASQPRPVMPDHMRARPIARTKISTNKLLQTAIALGDEGVGNFHAPV